MVAIRASSFATLQPALDELETVVAPEQVVADEERRRTERAACHGLLCIRAERVLHFGCRCCIEHRFHIEADCADDVLELRSLRDVSTLAPIRREYGAAKCITSTRVPRGDRHAHR